MSRLQKKCVVSTAGIHLLLLTILIFGPAFFNRQPKTDNTVLDVIPANVLDNALNSGVRDAQAPQPTPAPAPAPIPQTLLQPPPQPAPAPEPKVVQPPQPTEVPTPSLLDRFRTMFKPTPTPPTVTPNLKHVDRPEKSHADNIKVSLTKVRRTNRHTDISRNSNPDNNSDAKAVNSELNVLKKSLSSGTKIAMPGNGTEASASYDAVLRSIYLQAIVANMPAASRNDDHTLVRVTIARDGTVISSSIVSKSGDSVWDDAVQRTLDQVTSVRAFPDSWTEQQRTFSLDFNPQAAREFQ